MAFASAKSLLTTCRQAMRTRAPKIYTRELVELIVVKPHCRISDLVDHGIAQRQAASAYLRLLTQVGIMEEVKVGRGKLFLNPALMRELSVR